MRRASHKPGMQLHVARTAVDEDRARSLARLVRLLARQAALEHHRAAQAGRSDVAAKG